MAKFSSRNEAASEKMRNSSGALQNWSPPEPRQATNESAPSQLNQNHDASTSPPVQPPRLLDQVRGKLRLLHYAIRTEDVDVDWIRQVILFHGKRHTRDIGEVEIEEFLTHLVVVGDVSAACKIKCFRQTIVRV